MKRIIFLSILCTLPTAWLRVHAMSYEMAAEYAYFLSDKMAYELDLTDDQFDLVYQVNLDYFMALDDGADPKGVYWTYRCADLKCILSAVQFIVFQHTSYFLNPLLWRTTAWYLPIWRVYSPNRFFYGRPRVYATYHGAMWRTTRHVAESPYRGFNVGNAIGMREAARENFRIGSYSPPTNQRNSPRYNPAPGSSDRDWAYPNASSSQNRNNTRSNTTTRSTNNRNRTGSSNASTSRSNSRSRTTTTTSRNSSTSKSNSRVRSTTSSSSSRNNSRQNNTTNRSRR